MTERKQSKIQSEEFNNNINLKKGDMLYYARVMPNCSVYEIIELKIRTVEPTFFVGTDKRTKQAFLFGYTNLNKIIFNDRKDALKFVKEAEKNNKNIKINDETYYEEY